MQFHGVAGKEYDDGGGILFSPDSRRVAHAANRGNNWLIVIDGVEEKEYDARGNVAVTRQYRCDSPWTADRHLLTRSCYDHQGRLAVQSSPGGGRQVTVYNDEGKPTRVGNCVGSVEQSVTETLYDKGNAVRVVSWERIGSGTGNTLGSGNAVWRRY